MASIRDTGVESSLRPLAREAGTRLSGWNHQRASQGRTDSRQPCIAAGEILEMAMDNQQYLL